MTDRTSVIVGFTGTRRGMTVHQDREVAALLAELAPDTVVHGDCIGADEDFHRLALIQEIRVETRPCNLDDQRANCPSDVVHPVRDPLLRNRDIVEQVNEMIAAPSGRVEQRRSGTWATIRWARRRGVPITIVWPDGSSVHE